MQRVCKLVAKPWIQGISRDFSTQDRDYPLGRRGFFDLGPCLRGRLWSLLCQSLLFCRLLFRRQLFRGLLLRSLLRRSAGGLTCYANHESHQDKQSQYRKAHHKKALFSVLSFTDDRFQGFPPVARREKRRKIGKEAASGSIPSPGNRSTAKNRNRRRN